MTANSGVSLSANTPQELGGTCPPTSSTPTPYKANNNGTNRLNGVPYDAAGNATTLNGNTATYGAENRMTKVTEQPAFGGGTETILYDGAGQQVGKAISGGATTVFVYDAFGVLAAQYSPAGTLAQDYIHFDGQTVAIENVTSGAPCSTCYLSFDHLGSIRLVTAKIRA